jgi:glucosamine--fructose-6-phosphate aminotransferase (isomerizing)
MDNRELKWEHMLAGIRAQPEYLRGGAARELYLAASRLPLVRPSRVYLVGCGDSHYCGLATRYAFERWSGVPTDALESLEFSRYALESAPSDALVVAVSNSGRVTRTVECALFAGQRGIPSVGLTYVPDSRLAQTASMVLPWSYEDVGFGPGTLSYLASLIGLFAVALRLGELNDRLSSTQVSDRLGAITATGDAIARSIDLCAPAATELALAIEPAAALSVIGGGPNYGTALFGMAKFIEAAAFNAVGQELEEWAHEQYFCTGPGTHTVVIASPGASLDRAREQLSAVRDVGGRALAISDVTDTETASMADGVLFVSTPEDELLSPIVNAVPLELLALAFAQRLGRTMLGFDDQHRQEVNFRQIFDSVIPSVGEPALSGGPA